MIPLIAGGRDVLSHSLAGPARAHESPLIAMKAVVLALIALTIVCLGATGAGADDLEAGPAVMSPGDPDGAVVVGLFAPRSVAQPAGQPHWTLRHHVVADRIADGGDPAAAGERSGRADVSMFPWREILFYATLLALVVGVLFIVTGGGGRQSRQH